MSIYRKVPCSERLPEPSNSVIILYENGESIRAYVTETGYWFMDMPSMEGCDCDEPEFWLEEVVLPTDSEIDKLAKELAKESTAPDKDTPDWMESDIRRGFKAAIQLLTK